MKKYTNQFWSWYKDNLHLNIGIAAGLFVWQLIHLFWLTTDVVFEHLFSFTLLNLTGVWEYLLIAVDYTEIPAIVTVSLVYINELQTKKNVKRSFLFLILLNSQWLHLFWITDEFIVDRFKEASEAVLPVWLIWTAVMVDYLELLVIYDTIKKFLAVSNKKITGL